MANEKSRTGPLTGQELAAIDLTITAIQTAGGSIHDTSREDNPREQMAEATADAHHPIFELNQRDREILSEIKRLAGQLSSKMSLPQLLDARGKLLQGKPTQGD